MGKWVWFVGLFVCFLFTILAVVAEEQTGRLKVQVHELATEDTAIPIVIVSFFILCIMIVVLHRYGYLRFPTFGSGQEHRTGETTIAKPATQADFQEEEGFAVGFNPDVVKYLKEDEKVILRVLQTKRGKLSQARLRIITNFSKAKLSRLLKELEDRGIVIKEKAGKQNLVFLKTG
ncbi:hypothetical protein HYS48_04480 [Candidatus Woesearchaeota archaeon]|nr:hypothetical protein [Candidatus Woesearchaeota archaeon]